MHLHTTFWRSRSSLSHLSLLISCFKPSFVLAFDSSSKHSEHERLFGVPADDIDSKPVSESSLEPLKGFMHLALWKWWWWCDAADPSSSSLFRDESSLSEIRMLYTGNKSIKLVSSFSNKNPDINRNWLVYLAEQWGGVSGLETETGGLGGLLTNPFTEVITVVSPVPFR